ncbi:helix-turn-helix transcriptional regulator [Nonomuraea sp. KM90]|uniref:helix-turn-helix transcriptional regulator n=1 Tax=Nonomuraea sp. KM90 TaxID=3457428 RepID=UPI003FCCE906
MTLVGRKDALGVVEEVLLAGSGCVVVEGPAGIGKSRLLEEAAGLGRPAGLERSAGQPVAAGRVVAAGRATELDRVAPLSTLWRALGPSEGAPGPLDGALPAPERGPDGGFRAIERLGEEIDRFTRSRPLAIVLDDVQWADELTCLALRQLVPGLAGSPVVWLLARRPLPEQEAVERLIAEGSARRVPLPPLAPDEAAELCGRLLGAEPGASVLELARAAGGNPFLLEEVLSGLLAEGRITVRGGVASVRGGLASVSGASALPAGFVAAVERRLRDLSAEARRLLEVGAVLRRPFSGHEAAGMLGVPPGALLGHVDGAVRAGALVGEGDRLAFRHDLIREAVYGGLGAAIRTALHREAATVLRREGRPPAELAEHLRHGARVGDLAAVRELRAAAEEMKAVAPSAAADLMLRALDLTGRRPVAATPPQDGHAPATAYSPMPDRPGDHPMPGRPGDLPMPGRPGDLPMPGQPGGPASDAPHEPDEPAAGTGGGPGLVPGGVPEAVPGDEPEGLVGGGLVGGGLVAGVVRLLASAGRLGEAREIADGQGVALGVAEEAGIALGLAEALKHAGDDEGVIRRTGRVLALPGVPVRERARLLAVRAHALMMTGRIDAADAAAMEAVAEGEVFAQVVGLQARSTVAIFRGDLGDALRHAERAVGLADAAGGETAHRHPRLWLGSALTALDRFEEARDTYAVVERESGRLGTAWALPLLHRFRAELWLAWGRLDDAAAEAETGLRVAEQLSAMALAPALLGVLGHVTLLRGDPQTAQEFLDRGRELAGDGAGLVAEELRWRSPALSAPQPAALTDGRRSVPDPSAGELGHVRPPVPGLSAGELRGPHPSVLGGAVGELRGARPSGLGAAVGGGAVSGAMAYLIVQEPWMAARWRGVAGVVECVRDLARRNPGHLSLAAGAAHAEGRLEEAIGLYRAGRRPLGLAAALEEAGRRAEALAVYRACGAVSPAESGIGPPASPDRPGLGPPTSPGRPGQGPGAREAGAGQGWAALTAAELRVVRLVAQGMTNREAAAALFLSPHTIDTHLRHAFAKLGVNSRVELTRQALTHEPPGP